MVRRHYKLPPLTTLVAFEAAARHLSLKHAASELNVTPGAVSHQIKALESELGVALFNRIHRGVSLTQPGEELQAVLTRSFQQTAATLERIRESGRNPAVTIGATTAVTALWLLPRIGAFWRVHPDVRINHRVSDQEYELRRAELDLVLRYGSGEWPEQMSLHIFDDDIIPVCSPEFAQKHRGTTLDTLDQLPLIQMEGAHAQWTTWPTWFSAQGINVGRINGPSFNNYVIALQAAEDSAGVILGWRKLIAPIMARGGLVALTNATISAPGGYYLTWDRHRDLSPSAALLRDWLVREAVSVRTGDTAIGSIEFS
ncbi:MAG: LysR substrate-binding domain-containing protein [Hyphomicrobiaceae bacterium]